MFQGTTTKKFISGLSPEINKREIDPLIGDVFRNNDFNSIIGLESRREAITQIYWRTRVNTKTDYIFDTTGGTISNSGTNTITAQSTNLDAVTYTRKSQIVYFPNGAQGVVQSVATVSSKCQIVIKVVSGTTTCTAGDKLTLGGILGGEKSGAPTPLTEGLTDYTNKYMIMTEATEMTDVELANRVELTINGEDRYFPLQYMTTLSKLKNNTNKQFILGDISDTAFDDNSPFLTDPNTTYDGGGGGAQQSSRGLYNWIKTYGVQLQAVGSGSSGSPVPNGVIVKADIDNICDSLTAQRASNEQLVLGSDKVIRGFSQYFKNLGSSGVNSVRLNLGNDDKELDINVDKVTWGVKELNFARLPILDNDVVSVHNAGKVAYVVPKNHRVEVMGGGYKPAMAMKYVRQTPMRGLGDELIKETQYGANAPVTPSGTASFFGTKFETKVGFDFKCPSQALTIQVIA